MAWTWLLAAGGVNPNTAPARVLGFLAPFTFEILAIAENHDDLRRLFIDWQESECRSQ